MRLNWRWSFAGLLTLLAFLVVSWGVARFLPGSWLANTDQRLALGCGSGAAVAALVALWGQTFATAKAEAGKASPAEAPGQSSRSVTVVGDNFGIASAGDHVKNTQGSAPPPAPARASENQGPAVKAEDDHVIGVRVEGSNDGIASAGSNTTNVQEAR